MRYIIILGILFLAFAPIVSHATNQFSFLGRNDSGTDASKYTFVNQSLGTAASDRYIIVAVSSRGGNNNVVTNNLTINDINATLAIESIGRAAGTGDTTAIYYAPVPLLTLGNITVTFSQTVLRSSIGIWQATNINSTLVDMKRSNATNPTVLLNVTNAGFYIASAVTGTSGASFTWKNITEDYDAVIEFLTYSGGSNNTFATGQLNITATPTSSQAPAGAFVSFAYLPVASNPFNVSIENPINQTYSSASPLNISINYTLQLGSLFLDSCWYSVNGTANISLGTGGVCYNSSLIAQFGYNNLTIGINSTLSVYNQTTVFFSVSQTTGNSCTPTNNAQWDLNLADNCTVTGNYNVTNWFINSTASGGQINLSYLNLTYINRTTGYIAGKSYLARVSNVIFKR